MNSYYQLVQRTVWQLRDRKTSTARKNRVVRTHVKVQTAFSVKNNI